MNWRALALASTLASGCSFSLGATGSVPFDSGQRSALGPTFSTRVQPLGNRSVLLGIERTHLVHNGSRVTRHEPRTTVLFGWGIIPLRDEDPIGLELAATGTLGQMAVGPSLRTSWGAGGQLSVPFRISHDRSPWRMDHAFDLTWAIVPSVGVTRYWSAPGGVTRDEVVAGVALRIQLTSALLP